ncbi:hypothetical protein ACF0H5_011793 [Mactra antiquata]
MCSTSSLHIQVRYGSTRTRYCAEEKNPIVTSSSVTIRSSKGIGFSGAITIDSDKSYSVNVSSMTWAQAMTTCTKSDAMLAEAFPVVTSQLHDHFFRPQREEKFLQNGKNGQIYNLARRYWIGMSLTSWIKLKGCVQRIAKGSIDMRRELKNNQMSECAVLCSQYPGFSLSGRTCQCLTETNGKHFSFTSNERCSARCPGNREEVCGDGESVYTLYEFFRGVVQRETESKHCVIKVGSYYITEDCHSSHGFTCRLKNGSKETFYPSLPGKNDVKTKSLREAIEFCTNYPQSINMASEPKFPDQYFNESYWTTITRGIVWNPKQGSADTKYSYVATVDMVRILVVTSIANSSEQHGHICQHEPMTCGGTMYGDGGNITSINYPRNYDNYITCKWDIIVNETKTIKIEILEMDIEDSVDCIHDYLMVTERDTQPIKLCGIWEHKVIRTQSNEVLLTMKTDDTMSRKGFHLTWMTVDLKETSKTGSTKTSTSSFTWKGAAIAGIAFGAVMLVIVAVAIVGFVHVQNRRNSNPNRNTTNTSTSHNAMYGISSSFDSCSHITTENNGSTRQQNAVNVYDSIMEENTSKTECKSLYSDLGATGSVDNDGYLVIKGGHVDRNKVGATKTISDASNKYLNADLPSDLREFKTKRYPSEKNGPVYDEVDESHLLRMNTTAKDNNEYAVII